MAIYKSKYTGAQIDALLDKINTLSNPLVLKGRVDSEADLQNIVDPQPGWMYMVGLETDTFFKEFYYTDGDTWEFMGTTQISVDQQIIEDSENPVAGGAVFDALADKQDTITPVNGLVFGTGTDANKLGHSNSTTAQGSAAFRQTTLDAQGHIITSDDKLTGYVIDPATNPNDVATSDTVLSALGKLAKFSQNNKNNILSEQAKTTGMSEGGSDYITVGGIRVYVSATAPTGARTGDLWIGG